ncbi:hypothetical protein ACRCF9_19410 [Pseudomonas canadensis]|uniref:hypothetical protein n=1 Tax=Pseudomonas TaxID=286 RepID=UPI003D6B061F
MPAHIFRTLIVKAIRYKVTRSTPEGWIRPLIQDEMRNVMAKTSSIGMRHFPDPGIRIEKGQSCYFINSMKDLGSDGVFFTVCSYQHGHVPESITPDLTSAEAEIKIIELKDEDGKAGELVHSYRCIALGEVIIIESVMGSGGAAGLEKLLGQLFRRYRDQAHPLVDFSDIASTDLRELIDLHGGVERITARLAVDSKHQGTQFGGLLASLLQKIPGAAQCNVSWENKDGTLDENQAIALLEEADGQALAGATLHFKNGGSVNNLSEYRERKPVQIQLTPEGRPAITEIEIALKTYLGELRDPGHNGPVKTDGVLKSVKLLGE